MATTIEPTPAVAAPKGNAKGDNYLTHSSGLLSWALTLDHKRIGLLYLCGVCTFFLVGGIFAMLLRTELLMPKSGPEDFFLVSREVYNQFFSLHGAIMVFLFIIPGIPAALGNFILPIMLGAKDVAFPRLNLCSFYLWCAGACFFIGLLVTGLLGQMGYFGDTYIGGLDTGWTFYAPYSTTTGTSVVIAVTGAFILGFSSIFTGLNFIVTTHTMRPPGMSWFKMPLFVWSLYATALVQILATPVLAITLLLLAAERLLGIGIFDPSLGGDPVLFQHFFWFYSHPAVYIMILPGFGVISELIPTFSHKHIFGYKFVAFSSVAIGFLGFLVWAHHMFVSGQSAISAVIFSAITFTIAVPSGIKVFNWLTTMYKGSISFATPMLYALAFILLFSIGGLTGLPLGTLVTDVHLHDTYFVVAHFHYVMMGGALVAFLGGLFYWWPKMFGRYYHERIGQLSAIIVFFGFNATFFPQFIMGARGMPRRYASYDPVYQVWHVASTLGAYVLGIGLVLAAVALIYGLFRGKRAPSNPWGGGTLEWQCSSPPPHHNFDNPPPVNDPYTLHELVYVEADQCWERRADSPAAAPAGAAGKQAIAADSDSSPAQG